MTEPQQAATSEHGVFKRIHLGARRPHNWLQLVKFGFVGASGYVVNLIVFALLVKAGSVHQVPAAVGAFAVAVTNNFYWNRHWTFRAGEGHAGFQAARFFTVSLIALGINIVLLQVLVDGGMDKIAAQAISVAGAMPFNFLGNKLWTFR